MVCAGDVPIDHALEMMASEQYEALELHPTDQYVAALRVSTRLQELHLKLRADEPAVALASQLVHNTTLTLLKLVSEWSMTTSSLQSNESASSGVVLATTAARRSPTDMLRVNKHIRDVELQDRESRSHDKFAALASATVAIESFTSKYGASCCRSNVSVFVAPDHVRAQHMRPALPA